MAPVHPQTAVRLKVDTFPGSKQTVVSIDIGRNRAIVYIRDMNGIAPPRILITRLSHIGDCVLTLPLANAIKAARPDAFIAWTVESPSHQLLNRVDAIDHIVRVPKNWAKSFSAWRSLRRELRRLKIDVAIDPQGITKSALLGWLSGAKKRIGIRGRWGREASPWLNNHLIETKSAHLVDRTLELLQGIDIQHSSVDFLMHPDQDSQEAVREFLTAQNISSYMLINPGASWPSKQWDAQRFGYVARRVWKTHGLRSLVVWAGDEEYAMAQTIAELSNDGALIAPPTNLQELAVFCKHATFFVGCDTGPLHIASAMGTTCIGLYGPTRPTESGAYGSHHIAIQTRYQSGTSRQRRSATNDAMMEITPQMVVEAASGLLNSRTHAAA